MFMLTTAVAVFMSIMSLFSSSYYRGGKRVRGIVQFDPVDLVAAGATADSTRLVGAVWTLSAGLHRSNYFLSGKSGCSIMHVSQESQKGFRFHGPSRNSRMTI